MGGVEEGENSPQVLWIADSEDWGCMMVKHGRVVAFGGELELLEVPALVESLAADTSALVRPAVAPGSPAVAAGSPAVAPGSSAAVGYVNLDAALQHCAADFGSCVHEHSSADPDNWVAVHERTGEEHSAADPDNWAVDPDSLEAGNFAADPDSWVAVLERSGEENSAADPDNLAVDPESLEEGNIAAGLGGFADFAQQEGRRRQQVLRRGDFD